jgi:predicted dehydrogenase
MKSIRFGIIGCGLMGREFASAVARWCHLPQMDVRPEIVAICDANESITRWYRDNFASIRQVTSDYRELLANPEVEAVYIAVPHHLHQEFYCAAIEAGKHLMGEKPFGIDLAANQAIMQCIARHPDVFVRCSSEFPFFPAMQRIGDMLDAQVFGTLLEVNSGFLHSSDLDATKPINWKRMIEFNGEYGCLGDLGMHPCHMAFKAGWVPRNVRAILSKIVKERPDGKGNTVPCLTWDNGTMFCEAEDPGTGQRFPWTIKTQRIAPGQKNTWYFEVSGTTACARFSTKSANRLEVLQYAGGEQAWQQVDVGHAVSIPSITGPIFETGFSDSILQMWAAFVYELEHGKPIKKFAGCVTPAEVALSHRLFTAALESHREHSTVTLNV